MPAEEKVLDVAGEPGRQLAVDQHGLRRLAGIVDDLLREALPRRVGSIERKPIDERFPVARLVVELAGDSGIERKQ